MHKSGLPSFLPSFLPAAPLSPFFLSFCPSLTSSPPSLPSLLHLRPSPSTSLPSQVGTATPSSLRGLSERQSVVGGWEGGREGGRRRLKAALALALTLSLSTLLVVLPSRPSARPSVAATLSSSCLIRKLGGCTRTQHEQARRNLLQMDRLLLCSTRVGRASCCWKGGR